MIPNFEDNRELYVRFIQKNESLFDAILYDIQFTINYDKRYLEEAFCFFKDLNLNDDANMYSLLKNLEDFNDKSNSSQIPIEKLIHEFTSWTSNKNILKIFKILQKK
jgi:hypothetical protein